ncbi:hypothetical protein LEP1GSC047_1736 [Leptospira inadai serovar Lyme str. 10]|uniref:Uncharacterized protein n=2 Tax=Leptospira inadai serovar Lyme TaxID=293084 RepID=V6HR80_9LEPT|nr:hypothetical protein [Leptospira inadai]EQA34994.1 hypothetical protein LEP1GSC047_1736 [Leptospira inadai serovar Lyme str. 10]PNV76162.1 hypothetical protein BES34_003900 [Leptospira inadai serovar Lyme]
MDWKFPKWKPGRPQRWEFLLPPGCAKATEEVLESIIGGPFLPRTHTPSFTVFPEKFILEKSNFRQALEVLVRIPWLRDIRLNLGKFFLSEDFSFSGLIESLREAKLLPQGWEVRFHPQIRGRTEITREDLQSLWSEAYPQAGETGSLNDTELNALCIGDDLILSLSFAGEPLFKRGNFRPLSKSAPLREDLAVFLLSRLEKILSDPDVVLVPFAGSGTFVWEASSLLLGMGFPHYDRTFLFQDLEEFPKSTWEFLRKRIGEKGEGTSLRVWWNEKESEIFSYLEERSSDFQNFIRTSKSDSKLSISGDAGDFFSFSPKEVWSSLGKPSKLWMPINPPYGLRMKNPGSENLFRHLAEVLKDWWQLPAEISGFVLCPDEDSWSLFLRGIGTRAETIHVTHGGIDMRVVYF